MGTHQTRQLRVAEQIRKDLSELIRLRVKDPRVGMVTVTYVEVAADYAHAKVHVSSLLGEASLAATLIGLREAAGFLRRELGRGLKLRITPQLHFIEDSSIERGVRMGALIGDARAADALLMGSAALTDPPGDDLRPGSAVPLDTPSPSPSAGRAGDDAAADAVPDGDRS